MKSPKDEEQNEAKIIKDETENLQESSKNIQIKDEVNHQRIKKTDSSSFKKRVNESKDNVIEKNPLKSFYLIRQKIDPIFQTLLQKRMINLSLLNLSKFLKVSKIGDKENLLFHKL